MFCCALCIYVKFIKLCTRMYNIPVGSVRRQETLFKWPDTQCGIKKRGMEKYHNRKHARNHDSVVCVRK